jgi:hypothetical protein
MTSPAPSPFHDLATPEDLLTKLRQEHDDLSADPTSTRHAINAAFTAWHTIEWIWGLRLRDNWNYRSQLGLVTQADGTKLGNEDARNLFAANMLSNCPPLVAMRAISNGAKHLAHQAATNVSSGYSDIYSDVYGAKNLFVTLDDGSVVEFLVELKKVIGFWEDFLNLHPAI